MIVLYPAGAYMDCIKSVEESLFIHKYMAIDLTLELLKKRAKSLVFSYNVKYKYSYPATTTTFLSLHLTTIYALLIGGVGPTKKGRMPEYAHKHIIVKNCRFG
jgi:hypothetical protein